MKKLLSILVLSLLFGGSAHSFMTYGEFKELILSDETSAKWYLRGIINGNLSHSRYMNIEKPENEHLYCPPDDIKFSMEHAVEMIQTEANRIKSETSEDINKALVPLLYIWGMQDTYPCE
ncbi:hypothetical protein [Candidatus Pelagibacter sp. HIMB1495]|uniref:hypothetical protein n=1 Tax=unclassified Candidatus Pelagibacter TaxID=2647897 RepID=UPI003F8465B7